MIHCGMSERAKVAKKHDRLPLEEECVVVSYKENIVAKRPIAGKGCDLVIIVGRLCFSHRRLDVG